MLKYSVLFTTVFCVVHSQRPWHAGSGNRLPQVLPQYIDERIAAEQAAQAGQVAQATQGNRIIPGNQGTQGTPVGQQAQGSPASQGTQETSMGQGVLEVPVRQGTQGIPVNQAHGISTCQAQEIPASQGTQGSPVVGTASTLLGNRIDSGDGGFAAAAAAPSSTTINPADLPVDAHGDIDLVNRIKTWPRDKQPFWYINWQAIQAHRGDVNNTAQPVQTQPNARSFFAG